MIVECVVNVSEGRDHELLADLAAAAGTPLLDLHRDADHNRSVLTLAGHPDAVVAAARSLALEAVERIDLRRHDGVHPRFGVLDVVPFVPFAPSGPAPRDLDTVTALRDDFARWLGTTVGVPAYVYGPLDGGTRSLPELRRQALGADGGLPPDYGPAHLDPRTGATAVGARTVLVAYNLWVDSADVAGKVAPLVRGPAVRALGLAVGRRAQVSCNLVDPECFGPERLYDAVSVLVAEAGGRIEGAELVGLIPEAVLRAIPRRRWAALGLSEDATVEARLPRQDEG